MFADKIDLGMSVSSGAGLAAAASMGARRAADSRVERSGVLPQAVASTDLV